MKNLKGFYFVLFTLYFTIISCSNDDDSTPNLDHNAIEVSGESYPISSGYVLLNDDDTDETQKYAEIFLNSAEFDGINLETGNDYIPTQNGELISMVINVDDFQDFSPNHFQDFSIPVDDDSTSITEALIIYAIDINLVDLFNEIDGDNMPKELYKLKYIIKGSLKVKRENNNHYTIEFVGKDLDNKSVSFTYNGSLPTYKSSEIVEIDNPLMLNAIR